jgi:predicted nuclease of restriction endonuclease-like RecB superfamily
MSKRMTGIGNPLFGKLPSHGKRIKYKGICMRSSWEVSYAKYLDKNNWKWLYESKTFDLGNMTYTPDFYLSEDNAYVEIKGYWRDNALLKYRLFRKIYPKVRIRVLTKKSLKKLGII